MATNNFLRALQKHLPLLPLLLLATYCIDTIIKANRGTAVFHGVTFNVYLAISHYIAFVTILLNFLFYFFLRKFYNYILALTIGIGIFNIITFSALQTILQLTIFRIGFNFQLAAFWAGLLAYVINFKRINGLIVEAFGNKQTEEEYDKYKYNEDVLRFKEKYAKYTKEELSEIIRENKFVPEALEAAAQLLKEQEPK